MYIYVYIRTRNDLYFVYLIDLISSNSLYICFLVNKNKKYVDIEKEIAIICISQHLNVVLIFEFVNTV